MSNHSNVYEQLVIELYVRDFKASCAFYQAFGFRMVRDEGDFAELQWEDGLLFLEANPNALPPPSFPVGNMRILDIIPADGSAGYTTVREPLLRIARFHNCRT